MSSNSGTRGIGHTVHVGYGGGGDDAVFENIEKFENVVDIMNLPNGAVKFTHEDGSNMMQGARIIRSRVSGLDEAVRYRCSTCGDSESDMISASDRGDDLVLRCPVCEADEPHEAKAIDDT